MKAGIVSGAWVVCRGLFGFMILWCCLLLALVPEVSFVSSSGALSHQLSKGDSSSRHQNGSFAEHTQKPQKSEQTIEAILQIAWYGLGLAIQVWALLRLLGYCLQTIATKAKCQAMLRLSRALPMPTLPLAYAATISMLILSECVPCLSFLPNVRVSAPARKEGE